MTTSAAQLPRNAIKIATGSPGEDREFFTADSDPLMDCCHGKPAASSPSWGPAEGFSLLGLRRGQGEGGQMPGKSLHLVVTALPC